MALASFPVPRRSSFADLAPPGLALRAARDGDLAFLHRLYRGLRAEEMARLDWAEAEKRRFCDQQFALQHSDWVSRFTDGWFLLVMQGGRPVGRLYLWMSEDSLHLVDLTLMPDCRGKGLGERLLCALQAYAAPLGLALSLRVEHTNPRARVLYERLGFLPGKSGERDCFMRWAGPSPRPAAAVAGHARP